MTALKLFPVILCGGSGTRLWPMSRAHFPKQLLNLMGKDRSLLQTSVTRVEGLLDKAAVIDGVALADPIVICNEAHRFLVAEQLRQFDFQSARIILEPIGRNTAPALCLAAHDIVAQHEDGVMLVMPADHVIGDENRFHQTVLTGLPYALQRYLVTFGVTPERAETGYGYIKKGQALSTDSEVARIQQFVEKPDLSTAQAYVESGQYTWNSGMFLLNAKVWLQALGRYRADIATACQQAYADGERDCDFFRVDKTAFYACPSESIDYAVMEKVTESADSTEHVGVVVPLAADWSDVGSWQNLWEVSDKDVAGNVIQGDVYLHDTQNSMLVANHRVVTGIGLRNIVVVETADAVLVAEKSASQQVKTIVAMLEQDERDETLMHRRVSRPWGSYEGVDAGGRFQVKRIIVNPQAQLSLQMHHHRAEHWIVVKGTAKVTRGEDEFLLSENESTYIPLGVVHRLANPGMIPLEIIEVQSGSYLGEDDIVRYQDQYGRSEFEPESSNTE